MYVFLKHWNPVEIKKWFKSIKIEDNYFRYFFCFLRERIENERTRRQQHKKNMHVWPARMRRRWISARPLERNPQRKRNKLSGPGVGTWMRAGKELNWKKKMFPERTEKEKKKKKKECFFFFFSSKDNKCRKTTKDLGVMVHYHVCSFSPKKKRKTKKSSWFRQRVVDVKENWTFDTVNHLLFGHEQNGRICGWI